MPTTRPGFIWSGTEWIAIGQEAVLAPVSYQATAPSSPATGDIWIESDVDVPSIDSSQFLRWRKTMTGGETSLSGNDDSSLPLAYTPGYEQLYINGVLQVRSQDYTATTGNTVTGLTALVAGDTVEIFSAVARTVADVYTQTQSDARFVNLNSGGLTYVNTLSWTSGTTSTSIDSVFTTAFPHYRLILEIEGGGTADSSLIRLQLRAAGAGLTGNHTATIKTIYSTATSVGDNTLTAGNFMAFATLTSSGGPTMSTVDITNVASYTKKKVLSGNGYRDLFTAWGGGRYDSTTAADGFNVSVASGTLGAGSVRIYGYK
jgi:hypothetical protein